MPEDSSRGWVPSVLDDFGARLALVRHRMRWNVKEAALACGIAPASWRGWEMDSSHPREFLDAVGKIAARTGCDMVWLAGFPVTAARDQKAWDDPLGIEGLPRLDSNQQPSGYVAQVLDLPGRAPLRRRRLTGQGTRVVSLDDQRTKSQAKGPKQRDRSQPGRVATK